MGRDVFDFSKDCIFCGARANSQEHVWPDWIKNHHPRTFRKHEHIINSVSTGFRPHTVRRPGDPRSRRLRVTCERCNNGWLSILDDNAKPMLLSLKEGRWGYFSIWHRRALAAWLTRFSMVFEFADPATVVASFEEREHLRLWRHPPQGWYVFVGAYKGTEWAGKWNHRSAKNLTDPKRRNIQSTVATIGKLFFNVVSGAIPYDMDIEYARPFQLRGLWPESFPAFGSPLREFSDADLDVINEFFGGPPPAAS